MIITVKKYMIPWDKMYQFKLSIDFVFIIKFENIYLLFTSVGTKRGQEIIRIVVLVDATFLRYSQLLGEY